MKKAVYSVYYVTKYTILNFLYFYYHLKFKAVVEVSVFSRWSWPSLEFIGSVSRYISVNNVTDYETNSSDLILAPVIHLTLFNQLN
jgi:hypothetical protein